MNVRANLKTCLIMAMFLIAIGGGTAAGRTIYVDDDGPADFNNIQAAIDDSNDGDMVIVAVGTYYENINFNGKNITLRSTNPNNSGVVAGTIIDGNENGSVVTFNSGEDANCVLSGFMITNGYAHRGGGIYCNGASPTITNNVITNNTSTSMTITPSSAGGGICCINSSAIIMNNLIVDNYVRGFGGGICIHSSSVSIINNTITNNVSFSAWFQSTAGGIDCRYSLSSVVNTIIWGNINNDSPKQIEGCANVTYSDIQGGYEGIGNIDTNPRFVDPNNGDYHLKSQAGRYDPNSQQWVQDEVTSPCIDAGDMASPIGFEPFPNGGRINMGAYGGTAEASKSYFGEPLCETIVAGDINGDCKVNFKDFAVMASHWLECTAPECGVQVTDVKIIRGEFVEGWFEEIEEVDEVRVGDVFVIVVEVSNFGCETEHVLNLYDWDMSPESYVQVIGTGGICLTYIELGPSESAMLGPFCVSQAFKAQEAGWVRMNIYVNDWYAGRLCEYRFRFEVL